MITAIVRFKLPPGATLEGARADIEHTIPIWQAQPDLLRKQISVDLERGEGTSVYLWRSREPAERFFAMARRMIAEQTGQVPEVELLETMVIVDNEAGEVRWA